jgi:lysophospholipase L1-like esterase
MTTFLERWRGCAISLAAFGDSITQALHIADPADRWPNRLASALGATLRNAGLSGTVLQASPDASGGPRPGNGRSRYRRELIEAGRTDVVAILYGTNDARYTAAPRTINERGFTRDYRDVLSGLLASGYASDTIVIGSPPHLPDAGFVVGAEEGFAGQARSVFQGYVAIVEALAREHGVFYAPVNERMSKEGGDSLILADHVHPNEAGHEKIAAIFAGATQH